MIAFLSRDKKWSVGSSIGLFGRNSAYWTIFKPILLSSGVSESVIFFIRAQALLLVNVTLSDREILCGRGANVFHLYNC